MSTSDCSDSLEDSDISDCDSMYFFSDDEYISNEDNDNDDDDEYHSDSDEWWDVKTYKDLLKLNIDFILGIIQSTPYHFAPLHLDSQLLKDELQGSRPIVEIF